ncbi:hypothetical protein T484DRAFT_1842439, partial [Baffinella frigidus]
MTRSRPQVAVATGEEDEDILFKRRCKLFRFDSKCGVWRERGVGEAKLLLSHIRAHPLFDSKCGVWRERGVGEAKLLLSRTSGRIRVLMRREETRKVCANHVVAAETELTLMDGSDKAWTYATVDASGINEAWTYATVGASGINEVGEDDGECHAETFAFRFKDSSAAGEWKEAVDKCRVGDVAGFEKVAAIDDRIKVVEQADVIDEDAPAQSP